MNTNRRKFISTSIAGGITAAVSPFTSFAPESIKEKYTKLDEILRKPVLKRELFPTPVIIDTLELLRYNNSFLCRVKSKNGDTGISVGNNDQLIALYPVLVRRLLPYFIGKDARDLEKLLEG